MDEDKFAFNADKKEEDIIVKLSTLLMLATLTATLETSTAKATTTTTADLNEKIAEIYNRTAHMVVESIKGWGYSITPTEKIPDAFKNM